MLKTLGTRLINQSTGKGRVCLVTGSASHGLGRAGILGFAKEGGLVAVSDIPKREKEGQELVAEVEKMGGKAIWVPLDVTKEEMWKSAVSEIESKLGVLDVLVNNAGLLTKHDNYTVDPDELSLDEFHKVTSIMIDGVYLGHKYAGMSMKKNPATEYSSIINVSSQLGRTGAIGHIAYGTSKWAVRGMTKFMAASFPTAGVRVRVNSIRVIGTELTRGAGLVDHNSDASVSEPAKAMESMIYLKRFGNVSEVANLMVFLASNESSFSTASEFLIDGGWM